VLLQVKEQHCSSLLVCFCWLCSFVEHVRWLW